MENMSPDRSDRCMYQLYIGLEQMNLVDNKFPQDMDPSLLSHSKGSAPGHPAYNSTQDHIGP